MWGLTLVTRRRFGQCLGSALALAGLPRALGADDATQIIEVRIESFAFNPPQIEILVGNSVTWINGDLAPHTATAVDGAWDSGLIEQGDHRRITFEVPGEYPYFCSIHPHMKGTVIVRTKLGG
jgi:plastocyanin